MSNTTKDLSDAGITRIVMTEQPECEEAVIAKIRARREAGRKKYGTTMERRDLNAGHWLQHAQEEALDLAIYLERCMRELGR